MAKKDTPEAAAPQDEQAQALAPSKKGLPKFAVIAVVLLVQIVAAYFLQKTFFMKESAGAGETAAATHEKEEESDEDEDEPMEVVMLDELIVNPADTGGRRYLAISVGLQIKGEGEEPKHVVDKNQALIRDAMITLLSAKHMEELGRVSYRDTLKAEIKEAVNKNLHGKPVKNVVFSGYVLQ